MLLNLRTRLLHQERQVRLKFQDFGRVVRLQQFECLLKVNALEVGRACRDHSLTSLNELDMWLLGRAEDGRRRALQDQRILSWTGDHLDGSCDSR